MSDWYRVGGNGDITLTLHIQPGARKTECAGLQGDALKIRLVAPPVDGKANAALLAFIAERLGCGRAAVILKSGQTSRRKVLSVSGCTPEAVARLAAST
ncbi:MAG: DUF167 domain-containing protein [Azonexus sp.]|jgi:uncharacterized protein (TIGR00251 family)|uniref:DUF167 domain-containing protein n=1 Tax=Azonexus sp. TaxID=1872668 RepID=UPI00282FA7E0|nr:DUF167 domain-containing protein [Azonexus sp.]MDR0777204.1 DUF167 domain-containing protein [Azonexus sp.]